MLQTRSRLSVVFNCAVNTISPRNDSLTNRISATKNINRALIRRALIRDKVSHFNEPIFQYLLDSNQFLLIRFLWAIIIATCFCVCCYQINDRITWYFTYPTAVDVNVGPMDHLEMFEVRFISPENAYLFEECLKHKKSIITMIGELFPYKTLLLSIGDLNYSKLWDFENELKINKLVNVTTGIKNEVDITSKIPLHDEVLLFGRSIGLELQNEIKKEVQIHLDTSSRRYDYSIGLINTKTAFRVGFWMLKNHAYNWYLEFKKHNRVRTPTSPCISSSELRSCYDNCLDSIVTRKGLCRLPPHPVKINEEEKSCNNSRDAFESYIRSAKVLINLDGECNCAAPCHTTMFTLVINNNDVERSTNITTINLKPRDIEIALNERLVYDEIALLTDIGGNLGLFLGVTALSIIDTFQRIVILLRKRWVSLKNMKNDSNYELISKKIRKWSSRMLNSRIKSITSKEKSCKSALEKGVWFACALLGIFMIQERVRLYLTYPVRLIVQVEDRENITLPSVTLCGLSGKLILNKKKFAMKNNISDWQTVNLLDLVNYEDENSVKNVWELTTISLKSDLQWMLTDMANIQILQSNESDIKTHRGNCKHLKFHLEKYEGFLTLSPILVLTLNVRDAGTILYQVYIDTPESDSYNILTRNDIIDTFASFYDFRMKTYSRLNLRIRPCIEEDDFEDCGRKCLTSQLQSVGLCRLPFVPNATNFKTCTSANDAKQSLAKYVQILIQIANGVACNCSRRLCNELISTYTISTQISSYNGIYQLILTMGSNKYENIIEIEQYPIIALFCDIGNSLGIALGASLLTIIHVSFRSVGKALEIIIRKF